jgi:hypothetical protein
VPQHSGCVKLCCQGLGFHWLRWGLLAWVELLELLGCGCCRLAQGGLGEGAAGFPKLPLGREL